MRVPSKKHHFVPQFYLQRFAKPATKTGKIWVTDLKQDGVREGTPKSIAYENRLYGVDDPEFDPDLVERDHLSSVEGMVAPIIANILARRAIPQGDDFRHLMYFVAIQLARTPKFLRRLERASNEVSKTLVKLAIKTRLAEPILSSSDVPGDEIVQSLDQGDIVFSLQKDERTRLMLQSAEWHLPYLLHRQWSLCYSDQPNLVTSDSPVSCYSVGSNRPSKRMPALDARSTEVQFPLSPTMILVGSWEGPSAVRRMDQERQGICNVRTLRCASRFVYSAEQDFIWVDKSRQIRSSAEWPLNR